MAITSDVCREPAVVALTMNAATKIAGHIRYPTDGSEANPVEKPHNRRGAWIDRSQCEAELRHRNVNYRSGENLDDINPTAEFERCDLLASLRWLRHPQIDPANTSKRQ